MARFIRYGLYLSALAPLIIFRDFLYPFQFGKAIVFRSLIEILGGAYLILVLKNRSYLPRRDMIFWATLTFIGVFTLTTLVSSMPYVSFWGTLERMGGLFTFWHYFLYFIILSSVLTKKEHWEKFFNIIIFAGLLSVIYGLGQLTSNSFFLDSGSSRISGPMGNPAIFAGYELFVAFLSLMMLLKFKIYKLKFYLYLLSFSIATVAIFMTAVRGSMLAYAAGILVFTFLFVKYKKTSVAKILLYGFMGLIIGFVIFSLLFKNTSFVQSSRYLRRISDISLSSVTAQTRIWAWEAGLKGWAESPKTVTFGWGPENFGIPFARHFNPKFFTGLTSETFFDRAHNMFLEVLVTMGILGLAAYIWFLSAPFIYLRKLLRDPNFSIYGIGLSSAFTAYIIHNLFIFDTLPNFLIFFSVLGFISWAHNEIARGPAPRTSEVNTSSISDVGPFSRNFIIVAVIILTALLIYKTNILSAKANYIAAQAVALGRTGDFTNSLTKFKEALSYDVAGRYEYRHKLADYLVGQGGPSIKDNGVKEAYGFAISEIDKNIAQTRQLNHIPYLYGGRLNINLGQNDQALEYLNKALEISPAFIRTYYEIAEAYLNKEDYSKAIEYYQKAIDLNPDLGISYWYLGMAKLGFGDQGGMDDLEKSLSASDRHVPTLREYLWLASLYEETKNYPMLVKIYMHISGVYAREGKLNEAELFARKAIELDSSVADEIKAFFRDFGREF